MSRHIRTQPPRLSIIIPAKNESRRLPQSLEKIADYVSFKREATELIVVDNGSTDGTSDIVRRFADAHPELPTRLVVEPIPGKGAAVRAGMLAAVGEILFQCDADLSMPIEELDKLIRQLDRGGDIGIGCREGRGAVRSGETFHRRCMGRLFNALVQVFELSGHPDTQCGFKVFRRSVAQDLFSSQTIRGWGFDVEILVIARQRGYAVSSAPINWTHDADSRVRPLRDGLTMLLEVWAIRNRWKNGGYSTRPRRQTAVESMVVDVLPDSEVHDTGASFRRSK